MLFANWPVAVVQSADCSDTWEPATLCARAFRGSATSNSSTNINSIASLIRLAVTGSRAPRDFFLDPLEFRLSALECVAIRVSLAGSREPAVSFPDMRYSQ
jgi:hypothetical protein